MHAPRYTNPVLTRTFADPCVIRVGDGYLAVGAGSMVAGIIVQTGFYSRAV